MNDDKRNRESDRDTGSLSVDIPEYPRVREELVFRPLAGEWVVFDPDGRRLHVMNLTAALVWSFCDGSRNRDEIAREVRAAFPEAPQEEEVEADVVEALRSFLDQDLLLDEEHLPGRGSPERPEDEDEL